MLTGRPRDPRRDEAILAATRELLAERGYEGFSIEAVAERSGTAKSSVYRRWSGKRELVLAAMDAYVGRVAAPEPTASLREDLLAHCRGVAETLEGFDGRLTIGLMQAKSSDAALAAELDLRYPSTGHLAPEVLLRAVDRGELAEGADTAIVDEVASSMLLARLLRGLPFDEVFLAHVVDDVVVPALLHAHHAPGGGTAR
ncbi:TetR/AcrR family transcriptional regulator [Auraticoccus monumenti]|uniref:DNA-binding transcriptional regulator, AcrR family n=1 Tax=Auraticoccus monumenti TaxID=675864 RepID=A0A1G6ZBM8_9ACTN|nr:TetR/AcrR family transcriptional regulator [Auraticoccus monumenti]SDD99713.1 DNA-binding transcriptional regulator, AcrR family [Auraticoccus monumenti]